MQDLLKYIPVNVLFQFLPMILLKIGNMIKARDANDTGADDAFGSVLLAAAPAVDGLFTSGHDWSVRKALTTMRDTIDNYLATTPLPAAPATPSTASASTVPNALSKSTPAVPTP